MIWLASFPRSGNTYFRNILYEVYGIESSSYHTTNGIVDLPEYETFQVVKTHMLPSQLPEKYKNAKSVYLVRDGRDALVSIAHHRKDIVVPGSNYYKNLLEAVLARGGSFFGGWGGNVEEWSLQADLVIKYEDLIKNPIKELEKVNKIMDLPEPKVDKLPSFADLKNGTPKYGTEKKNQDKMAKKELSKKFYRRGIAGSYKDELPYIFRILFWLKNRKQMKKLNYY